MACARLLWAIRTHHSHTFLPLLTSPFFFLILSSLPSAFSPCPVTEPSVWTDCDIGCVGDRLAGVISEGEKNRSASLYLTPSLLHQPLMKEGLTGDTGEGNIIHLYFKKGGYLSPKAPLSSRSLGNSMNKENGCKRKKFRMFGSYDSISLSNLCISPTRYFSHTNCEPMTVIHDDLLCMWIQNKPWGHSKSVMHLQYAAANHLQSSMTQTHSSSDIIMNRSIACWFRTKMYYHNSEWINFTNTCENTSWLNSKLCNSSNIMVVQQSDATMTDFHIKWIPRESNW